MINKRGQIEPTIQQTPRKSRWWIWVLIILILIAMGLAVYFLFFSGADGGSSVFGGIPKPPALPE
tara:strand:+ start:52 stop:246 length:195 start_codon:yes stop_codon:yes gene_type:complete